MMCQVVEKCACLKPYKVLNKEERTGVIAKTELMGTIKEAHGLC